MRLGEYSLEAHLNMNAQGTAERDGPLLPTEHQVHLTLEPTAGLSENFALGFMFLNAWQSDYSPQFAGWRALPHVYAPESWHLPVRLGFGAEFSFQKTWYEANSRRLDLGPTLDREFARWQVVLNPVFERALHGPGTARDWNFEPALLVRWKTASPSLRRHRKYQCPAARAAASTPVICGRGVGFDVGGRGPGVILKSRFEFHWGPSHDTP